MKKVTKKVVKKVEAQEAAAPETKVAKKTKKVVKPAAAIEADLSKGIITLAMLSAALKDFLQVCWANKVDNALTARLCTMRDKFITAGASPSGKIVFDSPEAVKAHCDKLIPGYHQGLPRQEKYAITAPVKCLSGVSKFSIAVQNGGQFDNPFKMAKILNGVTKDTKADVLTKKANELLTAYGF